jgi:hypothetical protein
MTLWHVEDCTPGAVSKPHKRRTQNGDFTSMTGRRA